MIRRRTPRISMRNMYAGMGMNTGTTKAKTGVQFSVAVNGQTHGPFNTNVLAQMVQNGQLKPDSLVWKQGMTDWAQAETVKELKSLFAPSAPPPPPAALQYKIAVNGQTYGPYDMDALSQMVLNGQLTAESQVWKQGMANWAAAGTVPDLNALIQLHIPQCWAHYEVPIDGILDEYKKAEQAATDAESQASAEAIEDTLLEFKIEARVTGFTRGPVVTLFEVVPAPGVKLSKIASLESNIALRLATRGLRILCPIPGKQAVGIEVPNKTRDMVTFREMLESYIERYNDGKEPQSKALPDYALPVFLGKTISGETMVVDLSSMPHLLVAGTTGSGKSVYINSMILSLLYWLTPAECRMIFIDAKIVELGFYDGIPHLLSPVISTPKQALRAIRWCVDEMERRYKQLSKFAARNIKSYNESAEEKGIPGLPHIVVIIDEFADLMAVSGKELEGLVARLAAKSRAVGIHMVLATQRPSVNVITGVIKANIPARIAFMVASNVDSRVILDASGAEKLLGKGDLLYNSSTDPFPIRAQGAYVSEKEAENVVAHLKTLGTPQYIEM